MAHVRLDLSVPDRAKFQQALDEARTRGLEVSRSFAELGMISGTIESKSVGGLVHIDGVASIAPDQRSAPESRGGDNVVRLARR